MISVWTKDKSIDLYKKAYGFLLTCMPEGFTEGDLQEYFVPDYHERSSISEIFEKFVQAGQNYQRMPNVIKFSDRRDAISGILHGFDVSYAASLNEESLYKTFRKVFNVTSEDSKRNSWYKWSCCIVDSAKFLLSFSDVQDFDNFIRSFNYNAESRMALPLLISTKIRGIGFALSCDILKELGFEDYSKPDIHLTDICKAVGLPSDDQYDVFRSIVRLARDNNITPYRMDKVLWLICSGNYYLHNIKVPGKKAELLTLL